MIICYSSLRKGIQSWSLLPCGSCFQDGSQVYSYTNHWQEKWITTVGLDQSFVVEWIVETHPQWPLYSYVLFLPLPYHSHIQSLSSVDCSLWLSLVCMTRDFILYFIFWVLEAFTWFKNQNISQIPKYTPTSFLLIYVSIILFHNHHLGLR